MSKKYWKGLDELHETSAFVESKNSEFFPQSSVDEFLGDDKLAETSTARRDFLKFLGFSVAAATVAACEAPVTKAIPYVIKPENVNPGVATWYASTYYDGNSYANIVVKTREGRPIYIKGNRDFGFTQGGVNAQVVASVLSLYDSARLRTAKKGTEDISWADLDKEVQDELKSIAASGGKITVVANSIISPYMKQAIADLSTSLYGATELAANVEGATPNFNLIQYDAISYNGMREANLASFGVRAIPDYNFAEAQTIVSIGADFLDSWLLGSVYSIDYAKRRNPDADWMSKHFQFESVMSITGSNADYRGMIKPSEQANVLAYILEKFGVKSGVSSSLGKDVAAVADEAVKSLKASKGNSLVVVGSNNKSVQILANKLNTVLGAYGKTILMDQALNMFQSEDKKMNDFVTDCISGRAPQAVLFLGTNPVYHLPNGKMFGEALVNVKLSVSFSLYADETATKCKYIAPDLHGLESWMDYSPKAGQYAMAQPTIRPLFDTASALESLLVWAGSAKREGKDSRVAYDYISKNWEANLFPLQTKYTDFNTFFQMAVHNSCADAIAVTPFTLMFNETAMSGVSSSLPKGGDLEVVLYQKTGIGNGNMAGNPWLQELPDPISKVTWDNYITMAPETMSEEGYAVTFDQENGLNMATISCGNEKFTLPVYPSPGQAYGTIGIALGYGRGEGNEEIGNAAYVTKQYGGFATDEKGNRIPVGKNAFRFVSFENDSFNYDVISNGKLVKESGMYLIASTQIHHTVMARNSIVRDTTLSVYQNEEPEAYNHKHVIETHHGAVPVSEFDLWDAHPVENVGHRWGMTIDLNKCFGCGACLIACQSENNVPVVGKDEVRRGREMHWLRIDRYFASSEEATVGTRKNPKLGELDYHAAEVPVANPMVVHMPMMCQQCNHAPCESVCPVAATTHSNEGLNQMAYNRCIGTRYCANNCPYKVRRFNWFNYPSYKKFTEINPAQDDLSRMVLNPDVTVRTRGVMEKCSFCVQRIQSTKLDAKVENRTVTDGELHTACQDACPSNAIIFGDWNDVNSEVRKISENKRSYQALEEIGVKPNVWYQVKVRNNENADLDKVVALASHAESHGDHSEEKHKGH